MSSDASLELDPLNIAEGEPKSSGDSRRWKYLALTATLAALAVAMTMLAVRFWLHPSRAGRASAEEFINKDSLPRCVECYTDQCSLDYKTWSSCPQSHPYYSERHGACVGSSKECGEGDAVKISFGKALCADCFAKKCFVGHTFVQCSAEAPYYAPTLRNCVNSCSAPPGPPPALFDCDSFDYRNWVSAWSDQKKQWCCDNRLKGCHKDEICPAPGHHVCDSDTGATCFFSNCGADRGKTSCKARPWGWFTQNKCICDPGHCLHSMDRGRCVEVGCCFHIKDRKCTSTSISSKEVCLESLSELQIAFPGIQGGWHAVCPTTAEEGMKILAA
eukprot:TRINITY_DN20847_c0_g1_i1.p1 TRINITY_DN20847_c0_g1~~TRINITY_DN20847_c0_g1_i1.p1  ORF type:complete len:348 (-),score=37.01 TRINITY_DN20847_c0_g1_i1:208-1200(-)